MKELQIVLENCDAIKVSWENVVNLVMCKVYKTYQYSKRIGLLEMNVAENICLVLSKNADLPHQEFGVGEFTTNFKRLYNGRDISSIVLVHDDGKEEEFYVAYDEDEFGCFNKLQSTGIDDEGNLIIKIGRF
jgi:hypothetical protein